MEQAVFLVVDDDDLVAGAIARVLAPFGEVRVAASRAGASEELRAAVPWAGFVVDLRLPDGSGIDVLEQVRESHPLTPAVILTSAMERDEVNATFVLGAKYLCKPCKPDILRQFAREALASEHEVPGRISQAVSNLAHRHQLSPAQAEILLAAVRGSDRNAIVAARQVSENTHKSQVRAMLRKTRTMSLNELRDRILRSVAGAA